LPVSIIDKNGGQLPFIQGCGPKRIPPRGSPLDRR